MLFHTWPFLVFLLLVLPVFYTLRNTRLWLPWLTVASYFFYGWWNPYYLSLVIYITLLDFFVVALMDRCPQPGRQFGFAARLTGQHLEDRLLKGAFAVSAVAAFGLAGGAAAG